MTNLFYPIYDTIDLSDSAGVTHVLFQSGQGSSATKQFTTTNMRGSGQFPDRETFTMNRIGLHVDNVSMSDDDIQGLFVGSILRVHVNNVKVLEVPAYMCSDLNRVGGIKTEASASAFDYFGQEGRGLMLEKTLTIQGGKQFNLEFYQGLAVDTTSLDMKCVLYGMLDAPDIGV